MSFLPTFVVLDLNMFVSVVKLISVNINENLTKILEKKIKCQTA